MGLRGAWSAAAAAAGVSLLCVLVAWAALIGPQQVFEGPGPTPSTVTTTPPSEEPSGQAQETRGSIEQRDPGPLVRVLLTTVGLVVQVAALAGMLLVAFLVLRRARTAWQLRRPRGQVPADVAFDVLEMPRKVADAMREDAAEQARVLADGEPRDAIVACWHRFELQADRAGLAREPWETSSEFALRMLDLVDADRGAVSRLATLYREARFSGHLLGEPARQEAVRALATIQASHVAGPR
jgi:hypothetical protein